MVTSKKIYGLIGEKLSHSFSASYFNEKFEREGINAVYELFPLSSVDKLNNLLTDIPNLRGLNVTIPYKESIIPHLSSLSEEAKNIGAVNVIKIEKNENRIFLKGYNSDEYGFKESLKPLLGKDIKNALILGTGGGSKAVSFVLNQLGIKPTFVSREKGNNKISYEELNRTVIEENLLIVNTTPLGMYPNLNHCPLIPYDFITSHHICYDLIYNPKETLFLKKAKDHGATIKNGLEMLRLQADRSWQIWNL